MKNRQDIINGIAERTGFTKKDSEKFYTAYKEFVLETLQSGEGIKDVGFGSFEVQETKERIGRNPKNPDQEVKIPAGEKPIFKFGGSIKSLFKTK